MQIAFQQGSKPTLDLVHVMVRRQTITGSTLRPRPLAEKAGLDRRLVQRHDHGWQVLGQQFSGCWFAHLR